MCLYPQRHINKKYTVTKKNGGNIPELPIIGKNEYGQPIYDERILYIQIPCGRCKECCEERAREWQVRLSEEIKIWDYMYFVTFTFSPEGLKEIMNRYKVGETNAAAGYAIRRSVERYRKDHKTSYRHWFITELGHQETERIHMHGIIFFNQKQEFEIIKEIPGKGKMCKWKYWKYGHIFVGNYVNQRSVNYMVKYMNKIDTDHKNYVGQIFASPGIGRNYIERLKIAGLNKYKYRPNNTRDWYTLNNGSRVAMPKYYKNKLLNEEERELKWREFLNSHKVSIAGNQYLDNETDTQTIGRIIDKAQQINKSLDYGDNSKEWRKKPYNITRQMLMKQERRKKAEEIRKRLGMPLLGEI